MNEYIGVPYQVHSATSKAAAQAILPRAGTQRGRVYSHIKAAGINGCTDEEVQIALGIRVQSETARRVELTQSGFVVNSGRTRRTESDRQATVWVATSQGSLQ